MAKLDLALNDFFATQHQLVTREQFLLHGSRQQLSRRLMCGALERVYESVYRRSGVTPYWRQNVLAASLAGGRSSAAAFRTAAALEGLPGGAELLEIAYLRHRRSYYSDIRAYETRHLEPRDLWIIDGIQVTRPARTLCDLACLVELGELSKRTVELAFLEALRRNIVDIPSVWEVHERLAGDFRLGGKIMLDILQHLVPPIRPNDTTTEDRVLFMLRDAGFAEPTPQHWLTLPDGERIRLDFAWIPDKVGFEWDPYKYHGAADRYEAMQSRTRRLRAIGWERVCVTDDDFDNGMPESIAGLRRIFREKAALVKLAERVSQAHPQT